MVTLSRAVRLAAALALAFAVAAPAQQPRKKKLLAIGAVKGYQHDATSHGLATIWKIGQESGLFDTYIRTDTQLLTKQPLKDNAKNLDYFDAVLFYTTGELDMDEQQKADFMKFIKEDGKGFIGVHSAIDTFYQWPEFGEMVGGYFDLHPWNQFQAPILVEDPDFPAMKHFPKAFVVMDEIYQVKNYSRDKVRVLARLDETKINLEQRGVKRADRDFAVAWSKMHGNGRVFYSTFGHREDAWDRPDIQKMYLEAIKWAMKLTDGEATPRPKP